jgi:hypothetical protein
VTDVPEAAPLADDCAALRQSLIDNPVPPVWSLDAATARELHLQGVAKVREAWRPPLASSPGDEHRHSRC